jgi:hypothetical protein
MDPKSREWQIWCRLDKFSRSRDRGEIKGLTIDEIKTTLAHAQPSDHGKAGAYIAGEEVIQELEREKEKKKINGFLGKQRLALAFLSRYFFFSMKKLILRRPC